MNMFSVYAYIGKMKIMTSLVYRFEMFASMVTSIIIMFATVFLWRTVYHAVSIVDGVSRNQMVTYAIIASLFGIVLNFSVDTNISNRVQQGDIAIDFMRPTNLILHCLAEDVGSSVCAVINRAIPVFAIVSIFYFVPLPASFINALIFIPSFLFSFGILWLFSAIFGVISFWAIDLGNINQVKNAIVSLLSGSIIPIWFFPQKVRIVFDFLPFQYTYQTTLGIYIGKYSPMQAVFLLAIQLLWIVILSRVLYLLWRAAKKCVMVQGG